MLTHKDLIAFKRPVRELVLDLVNNHGIEYRLPDGQHLYLYDRRGGRPYKISAKRPAETSVHFLVRWARKRIKGWEQS